MKASALILTFNHGPFVGQAIEGFLMQKTDFPCELVIADDCSTDNTREVIRRYWEPHQDRIRVLLNRRNIGGRRTIVRGYHACRGQYVAVFDGDDYWTSPDKLQRQVDLLERHPNYALCFHSARMVWDDGSREPKLFRPQQIKDTYTLRDLFEYDFIPSCSVLYRKGMFREHPGWYFTPPVGDWPHHVLHAHYGDIGYIDEPLAVYRQHSGGCYSGKNTARKFRIAIEVLRRFRCVAARQYRRTIDHSLCHHYCALAHEYCDEGRLSDARRCLLECVREVHPDPLLFFRHLLGVTARTCSPALHRHCKQLLGGASPDVIANIDESQS